MTRLSSGTYGTARCPRGRWRSAAPREGGTGEPYGLVHLVAREDVTGPAPGS